MNFIRRQIERLEGRELPAHLFFFASQADANGDYSALNVANLRIAPVQSAPSPTQVTPGDNLHFTGVLSNTSAYIPANTGTNPTPRAFAGVHLENGYSGDVDFRCSAFVGAFDLCGNSMSAVVQNDPYQYTANGTGGQITVTSLFTWTAGGINTGTAATKDAYFNLAPTATGTATPQGDTVGLGSTLTLLGNSTTPHSGSSLELHDGTYTFTRSQVSLHGMMGTILGLTPGAPVRPQYAAGEINFVSQPTNATPNPDPATMVVIDKFAVANVRKFNGSAVGKPAVTMKGKVPTIENNGTLTIDRDAQVWFTPDNGSNGAGGGLIQDDNTAVTEIASGSGISCGKKTMVNIKKGRLDLMDNPNTTQRDTAQDPITISAPDATKPPNVLKIGPDAILRHDRNNKGMVQLEVKGDFACYGQIILVASRLAEKNDQITVDGVVFMETSCTLYLDWYDETGNTMQAGGWTVLTSSNPALVGTPIDESLNGIGQMTPGNFAITLAKQINPAKDELRVKIN